MKPSIRDRRMLPNRQKEMVKLFLILLAGCLVLALLQFLVPKRAQAAEADYTLSWCTSHGGRTEVALPDGSGRVDCLLADFAVETDWAYKYHEAIGQALYYSQLTGKKPAVLLILRSETDRKYIDRLQAVNAGKCLYITVFTVSEHSLT